MGVITYGAFLQNEVKAWPPLVQIGAGFDLVTNNQWWDDEGTPTTKATAVPAADEAGLDALFKEVIKCVTDAADEGFNQRYTYADEPRVKSGRKLSALVWVGSTAGSVDCSVILRNSSAEETAGVLVTTIGDWDLYAVEDHTCAGTYVELVVTKDTAGTFYAYPSTVMVGEDAIELPPRGLVHRWSTTRPTVEDLASTASKAAADVDITANTSPLAAVAEFTILMGDGNAGDSFSYHTRPNGSSLSTATSTSTQRARVTGSFVQTNQNSFVEILDDQQILETALTQNSGTNVAQCLLFLIGYWEWE